MKYNPEQFLALKSLIKQLKFNNIDFFLVQMPVTDNYRKNLLTNYSDFDSIISKFGMYIDMNKKLNLDDKFDFVDYQHLNIEGANKLSIYFLKYFKSSIK